MEQATLTILAVDPGRTKCGLAIVRRNEGVLTRAVVTKENLARLLRVIFEQFQPTVTVLGRGTGAKEIERLIRQIDGAPQIKMVDETYTSLDARQRFFREHPPKGLKRLIPTGLQTPDVPYDDYVAVILAERYLETHI